MNIQPAHKLSTAGGVASGLFVICEGTQQNFAVKFCAPQSACGSCPLRAQCLKHPEWTKVRQGSFFQRRPTRQTRNLHCEDKTQN